MADEHVNMSNLAGESSESTLEIHIKTLDSHLYNFRVDKNMLVSAFKEKIADEVGLPVGQQRLIFRGKVLKDEHHLSEYHIESGHTLHLVARQPAESQPSSGSSTNTTTANGQDANAPGSRSRVTHHVSHSVVLGSFGGGDQNVGGAQDISRVISAVLDSFGARDASVQPNMQFNIPRQTAQGNEGGVNVNNQGQPGNPSQSVPQGMQIPVGAAIAIPTLATPIPDSLHTLSEFMNRMEQALSQNGYQPNQPLNDAERSPAVELPSSARGVPLPAALAVVMRHAQRLLTGPATNSLSHTAGRLEEEESITDPTIRTQIQSEAMQAGLAMQHLGALLLELGRTMLTLRIGQSPAESSVHAGPAIYISPSGPNPIMVQPFPLQTNSLFGANATPINSTGFGPVGIGAVPRHINVHIHAGIGQRGTNVEPNQGERANGTAATGVNVQARGVNDSTGSENQGERGNQTAATGVNLQARGVNDSMGSENQASAVNPGQQKGNESKSEGQKDTESMTSSSSALKSTNDAEGASSSKSANDNSGNASAVPLGLGLGGLQPKRRSRPAKPEATSGSVPPVNASSTCNPAGGQPNSAAIMNEVIANPALDDLLSGVSSQTGIGSPDVLRNMLGQLTQNPAMMNTVNQIAQQIDGNQDLSNMFAGMGGPRGGSGGGGGGFDLSSMVQQMMPIVAQAFGGGGGGSGSNMFQQAPPTNRELNSTTIHDVSSDSQANLEDLVEKIEQQESAEVVLSSVVEAAAAHLNENEENAAAGISEICIEEGLAHEFMDMLRRDVSRRAEEEGE
ncbi:putative Ubiquitin-like domain-containing protein [Helianthus annuus]|nr:putative Ubiquitin-like domain-containing protein [Helianthus annuus]KAJ0630667.1 putative Ubiquitin-like domain-containing protein [Helianthus annuus]KAJ0634524.1 putative Ubiquitin-like domain-containing protein [Helianthus annuus]